MRQLTDSIKRTLDEVAAEKRPAGLPKQIDVRRVAQAKRVSKPWGFELWLSDATETPYAFKILYLKKGARTSLQYHREKAEHNYVLAGKIKLHYEDEKKGEIKQVELEAGAVAEIKPPAVHRVEAIEDTILIEASTNQLEDVVRVEDDFGRPDGIIESEHRGSSREGKVYV